MGGNTSSVSESVITMEEEVVAARRCGGPAVAEQSVCLRMDLRRAADSEAASGW